jgi:DnaJ-class molecular chaperone
MADPYQTLEVSKSASAAEIKSAYRKLAKKLHPDVNPGRKDIEQKFKEITAAYDLLSDAAKRARYDRGEIDAMGNERGFARGGGDPFGGMGGRSRTHGAPFGDHDPLSGFSTDDLFAEFFGKQRRAGPRAATRGSDITYSLTIPFVDACLGTKRRFALSNQKTVDVNIPPGSSEGDKLRLRGQGEAGRGGTGDALIEIHIELHPFFTRKDGDIQLEAPVSLSEAVLGASIRVPTLDGFVSVKVPQGANTGTTLRLKGKGVPRVRGEAGDMFVKLKVVLPEPVPESLSEIIEKWAKKNDYDPRQKLGW